MLWLLTFAANSVCVDENVDFNSEFARSPGTTYEFPHVPICKWASVSNWYIVYPEYEENHGYKVFLELVDDADELTGDISRPGAAEMNLRSAVHHFPQVQTKDTLTRYLNTSERMCYVLLRFLLNRSFRTHFPLSRCSNFS
jgi:hypothetical protein